MRDVREREGRESEGGVGTVWYGQRERERG
jgi:hypothetical protein